ncbi:MAG: hypothetical protein KC503_30025 [Myxococcales bacterium]|nr:hypothetical protein [Myxococcales bacterium]
MPRHTVKRPRGAPLAPLALAVALLLSPAAAADNLRAPRIIVCFEPSGSSVPLSAESLEVALALQLEPHGFRVRHARWSGRAPRSFDEKLARALAERGASFGVGYALEAGEVSVWVAEVAQKRLRRFVMGEPAPGLERSVAASIRTYVLAPPGAPLPDGARVLAGGAVASAADRSGRSSTSLRGGVALAREPARLAIGASYRFDAYPQRDDMRHGPDVWAALRVWRKLEVSFSLGFRLAQTRQHQIAVEDPVRKQTTTLNTETARRFMHVGGGARWVFSPLRWLDLDAGAALRFALGSSGARLADESDSGLLGEVALGGQLGARFRLGDRLAIVARGYVGALLVGSRVKVAGVAVDETSGLEVSASLGLHVGLL